MNSFIVSLLILYAADLATQRLGRKKLCSLPVNFVDALRLPPCQANEKGMRATADPILATPHEFSHRHF